MNSLRFRMVLGFAVVAIVPLAIAMALLSRHIHDTVRAQASERLGAALGFVQGELRADGDQTVAKLEILGRDPTLKRLYLVQSAGGRDLEDYLTEKRFLLGLDFLALVDTSGRLVAAAEPASADRSGPGPPARAGRQGVTLEEVPGAPALAMTASAPILYQLETAGVLRGGVVLDSAFLARLKQTSGLDLELRDVAGRRVVGTLGGDAGPIAPGTAAQPAQRMGRHYLSRSFAIAARPEAQVTLTGFFSTEAAEQTISRLQATSLSLALLGFGIAIVLGFLWSWNLSRPIERLATFSQRIARGEWDEPLALHSVKELDTLVAALERMRHELRAYRERLIASERHAAWSVMARKVAHEVRNPLTPIAVSVADLKRSYEQGREDFPQILEQAARTVAEEVQALKRMLQEFSEFGRFPEPVFAECRLNDLLANMEALYGGEVAAARLAVMRPARDVLLLADGAQLLQALVNLVQNGLEAAGDGGRVRVEAGEADETLEVRIADTGPGLDAAQQARLFEPDFTTKRHGSGLGLTIVQRIVHDHGGTIVVDSAPGRGTTFRIRIPLGREAERCLPSSSSTTNPTS